MGHVSGAGWTVKTQAEAMTAINQQVYPRRAFLQEDSGMS
jgi:hypothetical protein